MHSGSSRPLAATVAVISLLLSGCTGGSDDAGDTSGPSPSATVIPDGSASPDASSDEALVLSECGVLRARSVDARRTEYLGDPVVARVGRSGDFDLGGASPAPRARVGAAVTAPRGADGDVEVSRSLERRIARAAGVRIGPQVEARGAGPGNTFTNEGPAAVLAAVDQVTYGVVRWSADDCLAFPGETVRGTLVHDMRRGSVVLSCDPDERRPGDPLESALREVCPG